MKPLGHKAYGSIPHVPGSRRGPGDHGISAKQASICLEKPRDKHDMIIVQEKLDGSCTAVARIGDRILALARAGYLAESSRFEQHQLFAAWVRENEARFRSVLEDGERLVGEWLAQAHGTRYDLQHEPWVAFDLMRVGRRAPFLTLIMRVVTQKFMTPHVYFMGNAGFSIEDVQHAIATTASKHGAIDPVEGVVWRVERKGKVDFLTKWVQPGKIDGCYLPEQSGEEAVWNWRP